MKNYLFCFLLISINSFGQLQFGVTISPTYSTNKVSHVENLPLGVGISTKDVKYENNGSGYRYRIGLDVIYNFKEKISINSGIAFNPKRVGVSGTGIYYNEVYNLNYLQIPLIATMYSKYTSKNFRGFLGLGGILNYKINEKIIEGADKTCYPMTLYKSGLNNSVGSFSRFDFELTLNSCIEKNLEKYSVFANLSYNMGLLNILNSDAYYDYMGYPYYPDNYFIVKTRQLMFNLGVKFKVVKK